MQACEALLDLLWRGPNPMFGMMHPQAAQIRVTSRFAISATLCKRAAEM